LQQALLGAARSAAQCAVDGRRRQRRAAIGGAVDDETAAGHGGVGLRLDHLAHETFDRFAPIGLALEQLRLQRDLLRAVAPQTLQVQGLLVAEGAIQAGLAQAGGSSQFGERRALETEAPEHLARAVEHGLGVEAAGASPFGIHGLCMGVG
jgi:hypothetical protein